MDIIKGVVYDWLDNNEGRVIYGCDFDSEVVANDNVNGAFIFGTQNASDFISNYFYEAGEVYNYWKDNMGDVSINPFERPEAYTVLMEEWGVGELSYGCPYLDEHWNEEIELTPELIKELQKQICGEEFVEDIEEKARENTQR